MQRIDIEKIGETGVLTSFEYFDSDIGTESFSCYSYCFYDCPSCNTHLFVEYLDHDGSHTSDRDVVSCPHCEDKTASLYSAGFPKLTIVKTKSFDAKSKLLADARKRYAEVKKRCQNQSLSKYSDEETDTVVFDQLCPIETSLELTPFEREIVTAMRDFAIKYAEQIKERHPSIGVLKAVQVEREEDDFLSVIFSMTLPDSRVIGAGMLLDDYNKKWFESAPSDEQRVARAERYTRAIVQSLAEYTDKLNKQGV